MTNSDQLVPQVYANLGESYKQIGEENRAIEAYELILSDFSLTKLLVLLPLLAYYILKKLSMRHPMDILNAF